MDSKTNYSLMDAITIKVSFDIGRLSPNRRLHWAERSGINFVAKTAARKAWSDAGCPTLSPPVRVNVTVRRPRPLDEDNAWSACKGCFDGLFKNAIVVDDAPRYVRLGTLEQITGKLTEPPYVVFEILSEAESLTDPLLPAVPSPPPPAP